MPARVIEQELFKGSQFLQHALDQVELVPTDQDLLVRVQARERVDLWYHLGTFSDAVDGLDIDADRKRAYVAKVAVIFNAFRRGFVSKDTRGCRNKVSGIGIGLSDLSHPLHLFHKTRFYLKSYQVCSQHAFQDLLAFYPCPYQYLFDMPMSRLLGKHRNISELGKGECTNRPMRALGSFLQIMLGTSKR